MYLLIAYAIPIKVRLFLGSLKFARQIQLSEISVLVLFFPVGNLIWLGIK